MHFNPDNPSYTNYLKHLKRINYFNRPNQSDSTHSGPTRTSSVPPANDRNMSRNILLAVCGFFFLAILFISMSGNIMNDGSQDSLMLNIFSMLRGIGTGLFIGTLTIIMIVDWSGFVSLLGLIKQDRWQGKKRFVLYALFIIGLPLVLVIYLVRACIQTFKYSYIAWPIQNFNYRRIQKALILGIIGMLVFTTASTVVYANISNIPAPNTKDQITSNPNDQQPDEAEPTLVPTSTPTPTPTPIPTPTPTPTPIIIEEPTPIPPTPTPIIIEEPTPAPPATSVNNNPWGYDFNPGEYIYRPPWEFCEYFACSSTFWFGKGYVVQCQDGMFEKSGGRRGSCSSHGGELQPLYSH